MTAIDLDAARKAARETQERADKATDGPWRTGEHVDEPRAICSVDSPDDSLLVLDRDGMAIFESAEDAAFAAHARSDVPNLAALVLAMAEEIERLTSERSVALAKIEQLRDFVSQAGYDPDHECPDQT